jgi:hypothetical protein
MVIDGSPTGLRALVLVDGTEAYPRGGLSAVRRLALPHGSRGKWLTGLTVQSHF